MTNQILKTAFPYAKPITEYDPAAIHYAPEYVLLENIYSPLVELLPKGELQPGVASRFECYYSSSHNALRCFGKKNLADSPAVILCRLPFMGDYPDT